MDTETSEMYELLEKFQSYINSLEPFSSCKLTAAYMLFTRACNSFISSGTLCKTGLFVDAYNSARVGLETGWLALILMKNEELAFEWLTQVPADNSDSDSAKRYRNTFGSLPWIRRTVAAGDSCEEFQKTNIYQLLSTKSHANVSSTFFMGTSQENPNDICLYFPGIFKSPEHEKKFMCSILYCLKYLLHDIQSHCQQNFAVEWKYDDMELLRIAGCGYPDGKGQMKVVAKKVNDVHQALMLLKLADVQARSRNA